MILRFQSGFKKRYKKFSEKIQSKVDAKLLIFQQNPFNPQLNNHILKGKFKDYRSTNISGDIRAIYKRIKQNEYIFVLLGTHSELY